MATEMVPIPSIGSKTVALWDSFFSRNKCKIFIFIFVLVKIIYDFEVSDHQSCIYLIENLKYCKIFLQFKIAVIIRTNE